MKKIERKQRDAWKVFRWMALRGAAELLEIIAPPNELDSKYASYTEANARNYFLLKVLIEVQKAGAVIDRSINYIETSITELRDKESHNYIELQLESLIDEQSVWQRKLVESLVALICFSASNHNRYYYHYLLLKDLEHYQALKREQKDFFFGENNYREYAIKALREKIELAEKSIDDMSKCWYLRPKKKADRHGNTTFLLSFRQSLLKALREATTGEKTSIGYTYESSFAETSRNIHFNPIRVDFDDTIKRFEFGMAQCGSLITSILCRSQHLSEIVPKGLNECISKSERNRRSKTNPTIGRAEVGDFVLAGGLYLGEVLDIKKSTFGYESYCIKFLDERPMKEIAEDWYTAFNVQMYDGKKDFFDDACRELEEIEKMHGWESVTFSDEEIMAARRDAVIEVWRRAYKDYLKRSLKDYLAKSANIKI